MTTQSIALRHIFDEKVYGKRLDAALSQQFSEYSRSRIQEWIQNGFVKVNDEVITSNKYKMAGFEDIEINAEIEVAGEWKPEAIDLDIVYEDDALLVINKPAGLVVHPGAGNQDGTMVNALLHHCPDLANLPRAGIIHRIDKETTGLLVVAKTIAAHTSLVEQLQNRAFTREYDAVVNRVMVSGGTIDKPIGRHPTKRTSMAVVADGKRAITHYRVVEKFLDHTHLKLRLETGRTHQIRVHMAYLKFPLIGDPLYSGRYRVPTRITPELRNTVDNFKRQALHASLLGLQHPETDEYIEWRAPMPQDMARLLDDLRVNRDTFEAEE
ncbi:23S rRNA pseudouridine(1911/1915/1917) synthase RluD [Kangiella koreensis]|uniref:Pseudouridine synthase n=1 Tax=Kangiella koreensis (strain DSM 16069 / JCM 12317 / KCTC 12182 / SW-125) TaxID=523791 RepID=C7RB59_KANKD|nr:23S rRNA pseudouridine(1911/1915/1917) synthase RluD [Kangiella koreensis]ACV26501.1 pseudouridine synthase, RluA family [Kangiella koreensis DSM 16069]